MGHTYRTHLALRAAVITAAALWGAAAGILARTPGVSGWSVAGAAALSAFFLLTAVVYQRTAIRVGARGFEARSVVRRCAVPFEDVLQVVVRDGPAGRAYAVLTRRGIFRFTSLFARHRELFETLLERAGLAPVAV